MTFQRWLPCVSSTLAILPKHSRVMSSIEQVHCGPRFNNLALQTLPVDNGSNSIRVVTGACFVRVNPTPVVAPRLVIASGETLALLDLPYDSANAGLDEEQELVKYLSGNEIWPGSEPSAHCYCGHQFGGFSGQLGDGAVIYLGEVINQKRERWELQLKGAGLTPFSRQGDGRKVLRSSLREFLCSEAMYYLGVPTSRAGSVVTSDTRVARDIFYTGNIVMERASITSRIAPTFIRFGSFEITKPQDPITGREGPSVGNRTIISHLANYVIENFYPDVWETHDPSDLTATYLSFFEAVVKRTAELVACWQTVGFCHGVLNTDNMSIVGLTIDYGPFGFMDRFSWDHICNASDPDGRYSYAQQPSVCAWNCARLADCLVRALVDLKTEADQMSKDEQNQLSAELATSFNRVIESNFTSTFRQTYLDRMRRKLGLFVSDEGTDENLVRSLFHTMEKTGADFTNTFLALEEVLRSSFGESVERIDTDQGNLGSDLLAAECCDVEELTDAWEPNDLDRQRSLLVKFAGINRRIADYTESTKVLKSAEKSALFDAIKLMNNDEKRVRDRKLWQDWLSVFCKRLQGDAELRPGVKMSDRLNMMRQSNPRVVLRNYLAEEAIRAAEADDYSVVRKLFEALRKPFDYKTETVKPISHEIPSGPSHEVVQ